MSLQLPFINAERQKKLIPHFKFHPVVLKQTFFFLDLHLLNAPVLV